MKLFKNIAIPLILGTIIGLLSGLGGNYDNYIKPDITPPNIVFPIVWSILYTLMGISNYLFSKNGNKSKYYIPQLIINLIWPILFFVLKWYLLSVIWLILLLIIVILMTIEFYKENKIAAYLQIPYILWLIFATYLSIQVFRLN